MHSNWDAIGAVGEIVGAAGVIFSLLYLGLQVRADARARRTATIQQEFRAQSDFQRSLGLDADAADVFYRGLRDPAALSDVERVRFSLMIDSIFRSFEVSLHYAEEGQLKSGIWQGLGATMQDLLAYPGPRAVWRMRSHQHSPEFQSFIEAKLANASAPRLYEPSEKAQSASPAMAPVPAGGAAEARV
jgi:hypothetical protein